MMMRVTWVFLAVIALALVVCPLRAAEVTVFAASSLSPALREIGEDYQRQSRDVIRFNFAASSTLARQIAAGAPADLFFPADSWSIGPLASNGMIVAGSPRERLSNLLVIAVPGDSKLTVRGPEDLLTNSVKRIVTGDIGGVPVGMYACAYLRRRQLWDKLAPKVVGVESARAALGLLEAGNADAAILFQTDALSSRKVRVAYTVPESEGPKIRYVMALVKSGRASPAAERFFQHLGSTNADAAFVRHGFRVVSPER
jgi:molybdate transport system substrate-binding protein